MKKTIPAAALTVVVLLVELFCIFAREYLERQLKRIISLVIENNNAAVFADFGFTLNKETELFEKYLCKRLDTGHQIAASTKEAQYLALQNQINPHFLYNTLETIRSEAVLWGVDSVASMTEALATFFRYTISNLDSLVIVEDELENVNNYYLIQHFRFGEKISVRYVFEGEEETIKGLFIPKLILQPLVENSIYHGLEEKLGAGEVIIRFTMTEQRLMIIVQDDGIGMTSEKLLALNNRIAGAGRYVSGDNEQNEQRSGGIAVENVNRRIKLLFGEDYGLFFRSISHVGTEAHILLPIIKDKRTENSR